MSIRTILLCAIDIETSGPKLIKNGILSIGICAGTVSGNIIVKKRIDLKLEGDQTFDKNTYDNFWINNINVLETIKKDAINPKDAMIEFMKIINYLDENYQLIIISDCITFDIGFINYYLAKYLDRKPLTYDYKENFRPVYDSDSYNRGVVKATYKNIYTNDIQIMKKLNFSVKKNGINHMPEDDAEYIYNLHRMVLIKS
jgi:hypothetical protein